MKCDPWKVTLVGVAVLGVLASGCGTTSEPSADVMKALAFDICKDFVKDRLKAPSTAKFRNFYEDDGEVRVTGYGDGPFSVVSTVDAQNAFGGQLRSNFTCSVTKNGDKWHLNDISIT